MISKQNDVGKILIKMQGGKKKRIKRKKEWKTKAKLS